MSALPDPDPAASPWGSLTQDDPVTLRLHLLPDRHESWTLFSEETHQVWRQRQEESQRRRAAGEAREKLKLRDRLHRVHDWMRQRGSSSEKALRALRQPEAVEVVHPAALSETEAQRIWRQLLASLVRRHRRLLIVHGSLLPLGALATVVPGPNVWFVYLAWRTLAHWSTARGGSRALGELPVRFTPEPRLDPLVELMDRRIVLRRKEKIRALGERLGIEELDAAY